ncbi:DUF1538 domain-containing protein [Bariatricus massiliensis]|uniref:DUF1538 domain-containing protein n=1 Tax=Bariatricus massiliensis TaxID=1745713 RepID=A0ABS8DHC6_9FIRM|nr:DUF1538 domain-containing protein [Bariatricus massiliensis]MCB7304810.1 DUF1538 domain-containing protein [Bariatricus massiliensis]MCB7375364.1 DUF1538 domain-containing protein [Bariatricus massiliensis]MCB7387824.1 DUF1538 domain-containing protein [Bariatricus massiliensis]MCB7412087.1 DUF1538 domain-containing protein [Bariatricus massiliensis]MCQ5254532.1 DUF1538 domain-containing protein [Bariatricus massiliensis]
MKIHQTKLLEKLQESSGAVLPIIGIVLFLCFTIAPVPTGILMAFIIGAVLLIIGMMFFTLGAEMAMTPMGERIGTRMTQTKKVSIVVTLCFVLGFIITVSEPDLQVLAEQVPSIPNYTLIVAVAVGVGFFLVVAVLRMLFGIPLSYMLIVLYPAVFILAFFVPADFLAVAFDSGGVTTGPMTVPFIMALGIGFSAVRSDKHAENDSFGLVALCSVGPILAVLILGMIYNPTGNSYTSTVIPDAENSVEMWRLFSSGLPHYMKEMMISLLPILLFFVIFQMISLRLKRKMLVKIGIGIIFTYIGLFLFLTGVNVGFMPAGNYLGQIIAGLPYRWIIIPIGMVIGYFIVKAEPAVYVLMEQVEELTSGAISGRAMGYSLSIGVAVSLGLAMVRVLTGISILWFLIPGYAAAIILSFFVPKIFTAIAFDSGGVASGPMTATFLLPFSVGACEAVGGNIVTDSFGVVAMVAMTPLITIQILGFIYRIQEKKAAGVRSPEEVVLVMPLESFDDNDIIEL